MTTTTMQTVDELRDTASRAARSLTPAMRKAIENLAGGLEIGAHLDGRSQHGGFTQVPRALRLRGLIEDTGAGMRLTGLGRLVAAVLGYKMRAPKAVEIPTEERTRNTTKPPLTERDEDTLAALAYATRVADKWVAPIDVGAQDGTHHSYTLAKLTRRGLVQRRQGMGSVVQCGDNMRPWRSGKGAWQYRVSEAGAAEAEVINEKRREKHAKGKA